VPLAQLPPSLRNSGRQVRVHQVVGRLAEGVTLEQARAELAGIGGQLAREHPATNKDTVPTAMGYNDRVNGGNIRMLFLLAMGAVGFVLLIACANVANLLLARAAHRAREISVRLSLGATRWRIVRQLLVESVLLSALSGAVGLGFSLIGIRLFDAATRNAGRPYWIEFTLDARVFAFLVAISVATGVLFGIAPALHVSRTSVHEVLKEGGRSGSGGMRARRWTAALIVGELVLTVMLLGGAGFMMRSFLTLYRLEAGVDTSRLLVMQFSLPDFKYDTAEKRTRFIELVEERLASLATVRATTASNSPLGGGAPRQLAVGGRPLPAGEPPPVITAVMVGRTYFDAVGAPLLRGRPFSQEDGTIGREAAIVNQQFAAMYLSGADPLGSRIQLREEAQSAPASPWYTIVGVAPNIRQRTGQNVTQEPDPVVYVPFRANPAGARGSVILVRSAGDVGAATSLMREEIRQLDADMPLFNIRTMNEFLAQQRWSFLVFGSMFAVFAVIALLLSAVGLYAVTAYAVTQRTQEIGIRMALGAKAADVWWLILRRALIQLSIGLPLGLAGAVGIGFLLRGLLVQNRAADPMTLAAITALLIAVTLAACSWPARRAIRLDPAAALRDE
jgi:putative ABC transport system permease protein